MSDTNRTLRPQKVARDLKFLVKLEEGLCYLCSEKKSAENIVFMDNLFANGKAILG